MYSVHDILIANLPGKKDITAVKISYDLTIATIYHREDCHASEFAFTGL